MADIIDKANDLAAEEVEALVARRVRYVGVSATECEECGEEIPEARRRALQGIQTCVMCAELAERRR